MLILFVILKKKVNIIDIHKTELLNLIDKTSIWHNKKMACFVYSLLKQFQYVMVKTLKLVLSDMAKCLMLVPYDMAKNIYCCSHLSW